MLEFIFVKNNIRCVALVGFFHIQNPKGGALGILGGHGGSKIIFCGTWSSDFLVTITMLCAMIFALTSIQLAYMNTKKSSSVVLDEPVQEETLSTTDPVQEPVQKEPNENVPKEE